MRILLTKKSREDLFNFLYKKYSVSTMKELSEKIKISYRTLQNWKYGYRYIPHIVIPSNLKDYLEITESQEENWGEIKGGHVAYQEMLKKYGKEEMIRRRKIGTQKSKELRLKNEVEFDIALDNPKFLEFYGVLLGDGWLSKFNLKNKIIYVIGISGDKRYDKEFYIYLKEIIKDIFHRSAYIREIKSNNGMELKFSHKMLIKFMNEKINFPIGKKFDLRIPDEIYNLGFSSTKYIIRGILDTDGSFYFDKDPAGRPYPTISIEMKESSLINQLYNLLIKEGFKVSYRIGKNNKLGTDRITLKGKIQLQKWMNSIGSSNLRHLRKIRGLVTQPG